MAPFFWRFEPKGKTYWDQATFTYCVWNFLVKENHKSFWQNTFFWVELMRCHIFSKRVLPIAPFLYTVYWSTSQILEQEFYFLGHLVISVRYSGLPVRQLNTATPPPSYCCHCHCHCTVEDPISDTLLHWNFMKKSKHELQPILTCCTRNSATQKPSSTARNLLFWWLQLTTRQRCR